MEMMAYFAPLIPIAGIAILAFFVIGIGADQKSGGRHGLLQAFILGIALVTLGASLGSLVFLGNLGLRVALPNADQQRSYDWPPTPYLYDQKTGPVTTTVACTEGCELTDSQKASFTEWKQQFRDWQTRQTQPQSRYGRDLVNGLSVLLIAAPLFVLFFRWVQRDARSGRSIPSMRSFYFYGFALVGLLATIISGILLVNVGLRTVFLPADNGGVIATSVPRPVGPTEGNAAQTILNCAERCGMSADDIALVQAWQTASVQTPPPHNARQSDLATNLPILLVGLPVFLYHFITIRRETRAGTPPSATPTPA